MKTFIEYIEKDSKNYLNEAFSPEMLKVISKQDLKSIVSKFASQLNIQSSSFEKVTDFLDDKGNFNKKKYDVRNSNIVIIIVNKRTKTIYVADSLIDCYGIKREKLASKFKFGEKAEWNLTYSGFMSEIGKFTSKSDIEVFVCKYPVRDREKIAWDREFNKPDPIAINGKSIEIKMDNKHFDDAVKTIFPSSIKYDYNEIKTYPSKMRNFLEEAGIKALKNEFNLFIENPFNQKTNDAFVHAIWDIKRNIDEYCNMLITFTKFHSFDVKFGRNYAGEYRRLDKDVQDQINRFKIYIEFFKSKKMWN